MLAADLGSRSVDLAVDSRLVFSSWGLFPRRAVALAEAVILCARARGIVSFFVCLASELIFFFSFLFNSSVVVGGVRGEVRWSRYFTGFAFGLVKFTGEEILYHSHLANANW